jgi:hypothetical protein
MVGVPNHIFGARSISYISMLFVPIGAMAFDIAGKVFSNMFFPTQTQIHVELEAKEFADVRKSRRHRGDSAQGN